MDINSEGTWRSPAADFRPDVAQKSWLALIKPSQDKLLTSPIWAPACQGYLVGLASLTTHMPGHIIKAGPGPSSEKTDDSEGPEITVTRATHLKSKHTILPPDTKIVTSSILASGPFSYHPQHRSQRRRHEKGRRSASGHCSRQTAYHREQSRF